jgi:hypothetical protein
VAQTRQTRQKTKPANPAIPVPLPPNTTSNPTNKPLRLRGGRNTPPQTSHIKIGTLNIKGTNSHNTKNKWNLIMTKMKKEKLAILCLSKTHTDETQELYLNNRYKTTHQILHSYNPDHTRVGRVAIILNKEIVKSAPTHTENLIPGRAILTNLKWTPNNQLSILAVYMPNITHSG